MKLIINQQLRHSVRDCPKEDMDDLVYYFNDMHKLLESCSVTHSYEILEDGCILTIYPQKITLDEGAMNDLFYNVFGEFDYALHYAALGGAGCDFSLTLVAQE